MCNKSAKQPKGRARTKTNIKNLSGDRFNDALVSMMRRLPILALDYGFMRH